MTTVAQVNQLRALALQVTAGDLRRPWRVQTSNSWRRIGTDRGDGDVVCPTVHHRDGSPDLTAAPGVLDYIVAAHPFIVTGLIEQRDRAWHAIDYLRHKIAGHDEAFVIAEEIRLNAVAPLPVSSGLAAAYDAASHAMATQHDTTGEPSCDADGVSLKRAARSIPAAPPLPLPPLGQADRERAEKGDVAYRAFAAAKMTPPAPAAAAAARGSFSASDVGARARELLANDETDSAVRTLVSALVAEADALERENDRLRHGMPVEGDFACPDALALVAMTQARDEACTWIADRSSDDSALVARLRAVGMVRGSR